MTRVEFRIECRRQRCCQVPGCEKSTAPWGAHHVVYEQEVRRRGRPPFDARNALRVCNRHHSRHHNGIERIPLAALSETNIEYAREVLGDYAIDYLASHYAA